MRSFVRAAAFVASVALVSIAVAEAPSANSTTATVASASTAPPSADADSTATGAPAPAKPVVSATGYSYGASTTPSTTQRVERTRRRTARSNPAGSDALMPGFETLADGSTRLFVDLSKPAAYDTKPGRAAITYVLKGVRVDRRNNQNPLVTVHFNTPVTSARLVPHGVDLWFVVDLRANVQPTATMDAAKDGAATLRVAFPKGEYLPPEPSGSASPASSAEASAPSSAPAALVPATKPAAKSTSPAIP